jgi:hypothetical protein
MLFTRPWKRLGTTVCRNEADSTFQTMTAPPSNASSVNATAPSLVKARPA